MENANLAPFFSQLASTVVEASTVSGFGVVFQRVNFVAPLIIFRKVEAFKRVVVMTSFEFVFSTFAFVTFAVDHVIVVVALHVLSSGRIVQVAGLALIFPLGVVEI